MKIGIIGCGRFGSCLAGYLAQKGVDLLILDRNRDVVQRMSDVVSRAVRGDATEESVLKEAGFGDCETVVVAIGINIDGSILAAMTLKEMGIPFVAAKAVTELHGKVLERIGVNRVLYPDRDMALRLASLLTTPILLDYMAIAEGAAIVEIKAPAGTVGKTLLQSEIRKIHGVIVLALKKRTAEGRRRTILVPGPDDVIEADDVMVLFGPDRNLRQIEALH